MRKIVIAAVALASAALVAAGCGSSGSSSSTSGGAAKAGGTLNFNIGSEPKALDPDLVQTLYDANVSGAEWVGLNKFDKNDNLVPALEASDSVSSDGLTYTFKLRPAKWSDGSPITASDFIYGIKRALDPKTAAPYASFLSVIQGADGKSPLAVTAVDPQTLQIKLTAVTPWFKLLTALPVMYPVPAKSVQACGAKWTDPSACKDILVSGAFKPTKWVHNSEIDLVKNPDYYDASNVKLDGLHFVMIASGQSAYRKYTTGEIDGGFAQKMIDPADMPRASKDPGFHSTPLLATGYIYLNTKNNPITKNKLVRQAIALAVNRPAIIKAGGNIGDVPISTFIPPGIAGSSTILGGQHFVSDPTKTDVDKAKQLIQQSGIPAGSTLNLSYTTEGGNDQEEADEIQSDLSAIGLKVKEDPKASFSTLLSNGLGLPPLAQSTGGVMLGWVQDYDEATDFFQILISAQNAPGGLNSSNYANPTYDNLFNKAVSTQDDTTRWGLEQQLEQILTGPNGDFPAVPLDQQADDTLISTHVHGWFETNGGLVYFDGMSKG